jgi:hypothetical protein
LPAGAWIKGSRYAEYFLNPCWMPV